MSTSGTGTDNSIHPKPKSDLSSKNPTGTNAPHPAQILKKKPSSELKQSSSSRKRSKRAKVIDASSNDECIPLNSTVGALATTIEINLCQTKNMCHYIRGHHDAMRETANSRRCIGYLETPQMYKHRFYVREKQLRIERHVSKLHSIFDAMRCDVKNSLNMTDQVRLAHRASRAILQYNNTPWLNSRWRLYDMKFFGRKDDLNEDALKTLHVSSQLSPPKSDSTTGCHMEDIQETRDTVSDEIRYGINNVTLFFLGVALLEIAHWKPIEDLMTTRDSNDQVFAARRIASQPTFLGPVYHKIARKCLQGNFGTEPDLGQKNLQTAVYNDVICELESMLQKLEV
jgi:hypothetical protein